MLLASRVFKPSLTVRAGVYTNYEAFGWFIMPLLGIDWRIDAKTNLYGVLPGSMNFERKSTPWFHWGLAFRAYTSSLGIRGGDYRRINENPLGLYGDLYFASNLVLRLEGGWCFIRQVFGGPGDPLYDPASLTRSGYAGPSYRGCALCARASSPTACGLTVRRDASGPPLWNAPAPQRAVCTIPWPMIERQRQYRPRAHRTQHHASAHVVHRAGIRACHAHRDAIIRRRWPNA